MFDALLKMAAKHLLWPFYFVFNVVCCSPLLFGLKVGAKVFSANPHLHVLGIVCYGLFGLSVCALLAMSYKMMEFHVDWGYPFTTSFSLVWVGAWRSLISLPLIRNWFEPDETIPRPKEAEDEKASEERER